VPLLTTAAGTKFGKSEDGNVWLDPAKTSPYKFYQFWINQDDRDLPQLFRTFTFLPPAEIDTVLVEHARAPERRLAQRMLAADLTTRVHGAEALAKAEGAAAALFAGGAADASAVLEAEMPEVRVPAADFGHGMAVVDLLVRSGLAASKGEARRGIEGRGFYLDGEPITDPAARVSAAAMQEAEGVRFVVLRKGKRNYVRLVVSGES
jgi:tyrosyl-tRNA synthetase